MMNRTARTQAASTPERIRQLVAEGAAYRDGIGRAARQVEAGLHAGPLLKTIAGSLGTAASGTVLHAALPLLVSGVAALLRKPPSKSAVRNILVAGIVGAAVVIIVQRGKAARISDNAAEPNAADFR